MDTDVPDLIPRGRSTGKPNATQERSMQEEKIPEALPRQCCPSAAGDRNAEHDIYDDDVICDYPQSGERILGRNNIRALGSHHRGTASGINVRRIFAQSDL